MQKPRPIDVLLRIPPAHYTLEESMKICQYFQSISQAQLARAKESLNDSEAMVERSQAILRKARSILWFVTFLTAMNLASIILNFYQLIHR